MCHLVRSGVPAWSCLGLSKSVPEHKVLGEEVFLGLVGREMNVHLLGGEEHHSSGSSKRLLDQGRQVPELKGPGERRV